MSHLASTGHPLLAQQKIRTLRIYLGATTALYLYGVLGSLLIIRAREPLIDHVGGIIAVMLGSVALIALAITPRSQGFATLAAIIATPAVMAAHKNMMAEFVCLIAAMFLGIHLRAFFAPRRAFALITLLLILCETAVYVAPALKLGFIDYLIIAVAIIGAAESFGFVTRALLAAVCTDALTGIQNRVGWEVSTTHLLGLYRRSPEATITVAAIDFDRLKAINDTYGHLAGDQRIREYTEYWRTTAPAASVLARLGGDEFAICIAHINSAIVDQFLDAVRQHTPHVSIGVASNAANQANVTELYAIADAALYATRGKYLLDEPPDPSR
ncbi:hypothetical protein BOO86_19770 [Mycobacterium sp. CBMA 234]|nr:hypothetical protein [Mycolicibacterium sp. CBMA 234]